MQQKVVFDTNIYIDIFNSGLHANLNNPFRYIAFLTHPVLHELWMGAKGKQEIAHLINFQNRFVQLRRIIIPTAATLVAIGQLCQKLRRSGRLEPVHPKIYNDISIAALARQVGAAVITRNAHDFRAIQTVIDFDFIEP